MKREGEGKWGVSLGQQKSNARGEPFLQDKRKDMITDKGKKKKKHTSEKGDVLKKGRSGYCADIFRALRVKGTGLLPQPSTAGRFPLSCSCPFPCPISPQSLNPP
ncbi:hypothetical protein WR25_24073 [Diploscapter pachys]|uniref:Uncharacterized protein n=1 Tax=Diploscapter pachys TaxID=2018661 RepID=A0A2A2J2S2_9BILA|nr:hypothetical protein WR25_24073 [Diploscapter pachys]